MTSKYTPFIFAGVAALIAPLFLIKTGTASDHADTPQIAQNPGTDITDVYLFPSPQDNGKVVLVMNVNPLIGPGQGLTTYFDPNVLYQFKIDNTGDFVEDLVIQARFTQKGPNQKVKIMGPFKPLFTGNRTVVLATRESFNPTNKVFKDSKGARIFAGAREDSFFFDLERFFAIFPDRATPITGQDIPNPNEPQLTSWRDPQNAVDFLSNGGFNVLSIVVELPKSMLRGKKGNDDQRNIISVWTTTSVPSGNAWVQRDRLARPVVNEVFATVANGRHQVNDEISPIQDAGELRDDILGFMTFPAGRSDAIKNVIAAVLVPDVMRANLKGNGAAYLGFENQRRNRRHLRRAEAHGRRGGHLSGRGLLNDD